MPNSITQRRTVILGKKRMRHQMSQYHGKVETITGQPAPHMGSSLEDTAEDLDTVDDD